MWGLSAAQMAAVGVAAAVLGPAAMSAGATGIVITAPVWISALVLAFVAPRGRTLVSWTPVVVHALLRRIRGQALWLIRPDRPRSVGTLSLPGESASLRLHRHDPSGAAFILDPHRRTLTGVIRVRHDVFLLLSVDDQNRRVAGWGQALSGACRTGRMSRLQVLVRSLPEGGNAVRTHWERDGRQDSRLAAESYGQLVSNAEPTSSRHEALLSVTVSLKDSARAVRSAGGGVAGAADVLARELTSLTANLRSAEINVDAWLDESDLARLINTAFRPHHTPAWERSGLGRDVAVAGPVAVSSEWDHLRIDDGWHAVLWIKEWTREEVDATFLVPLLLATSVQRSVSVVYRPRTVREATRQLKIEQAEQESEQRRRDKRDIRTTAAQRREQEDVDKRERELVSGHADLAFTGLVTVSAGSKEELELALEETETACHHCGLDTVVLYGQQDTAFYAGLPFGRMLL
ncbi:SCO6880 family protein [Phytoactinopolyspora limicola]|uniref:SCO6880 family protein n=1 Tax=Phytoactinopolyspora limicola TaxID=2715536 RepID=UPI00140920FA|nr:SCO6880 family protein [Phytoactinopolyspora limicola]